ncbi:MAG: hypothetical protein ACTS6A_02655 [Candidatus Hodgkinia cicadicola]
MTAERFASASCGDRGIFKELAKRRNTSSPSKGKRKRGREEEAFNGFLC